MSDPLLTRTLEALNSPVGSVECRAVRTAQVTTVVVTSAAGAVQHKGEETGYFQFGRSDFVMLVKRATNVKLRCERNRHYRRVSLFGDVRKNMTKV